MAKKLPEYSMLVPYDDLCELLQASQQVKEYKAEVAHYKEQVLALRIITQQCMEKIKELEKLL